ncbi:MAG: hypothetical protein IJ468_08720 [Lachnospiraceae bacterium]|nr:hypothetical protein [Lachnospiraceae bacterium]
MSAYENDRFVIPEKYLKMSTEELEREQEKMLEIIKKQPKIMPDKEKMPLKENLFRF